jgi:YidC/Oxa1 family membrane protein insertase
MNGIYLLLDKAGIPNVALAIILFTIVMYLLMTPLQISQQRFSKLNAVMSPEIQKVQAKYKGKRDQVSQQKMLDETNAIYAKYGVNQAGSCIQLLIQMPVLFALYQVIYHIPGYIGLIGGKLRVVAEDASFVSFFTKFVEKLPNNAQLTATLGTGSKLTTESVMDTIYKLNPSQWSELLKEAADKDYSAGLVSLHDYIERATNFVVMNISDTPMNLITTSFKAGQWGVLIAAVLIPLLAWGTQVLNMKLMPTANVNKDSKDSMSQTMNTMNTFMPLMSAFFCLTLPVGIGIYWIAGAVVRSIQQFIINKKLDRESIDEIIAKNQKKMNDKRAKKGCGSRRNAKAPIPSFFIYKYYTTFVPQKATVFCFFYGESMDFGVLTKPPCCYCAIFNKQALKRKERKIERMKEYTKRLEEKYFMNI